MPPNHVISSTVVSKTRNIVESFESSDHPITSRQLWVLASFSPDVAKLPISSSDTPRQMRNMRVKIHGSCVTVMSMAAAILPGERRR